jgi:hypothetical protein
MHEQDARAAVRPTCESKNTQPPGLSGPIRNFVDTPYLSCSGGGGQRRSVFGEAVEKPVEIAASELPGKRLGDSLVAFLKGDEAFGQNVEVGEVVGSEDLALDYREVDLDLALSQEA